eukprot:scaffold29716_cov62-Isochrysis_galbana.AAC.1
MPTMNAAGYYPTMGLGGAVIGGGSILSNGLPNTLPNLHGHLAGMLPGMPLGGLGAPAAAPPAPAGPATQIVLLKNMFDPNGKDEISDPDFFTDMHEDVLEEGAKFGVVAEAKIIRHSAGHVYLRFTQTEAAARAAASLHGRWFAGKQVLAEFVDEYAYAAA